MGATAMALEQQGSKHGEPSLGQGLRTYYKGKIEGLEMQIREKQSDLRRMEAQRNDLNSKGRDSRYVRMFSCIVCDMCH